MRWNGHEKELWGGDKATTNNRMEMQAVIEALNALKKPSKITLHVDSVITSYSIHYTKLYEVR